MLTVDEFITKVETHPLSFFRYSLESIIDEYISTVRDSLSHKFLWELDSTVMSDIQKTVKNIHKRRNPLWTLLSFFLPLDDTKEQNKKKLHVLLDNIHTDKYRLTMELKKNKEALERVSTSLEYLQLLKNKLDDNTFLIKEIDDKIVLIEGYELALSLRKINFLELKKIYEMI